MGTDAKGLALLGPSWPWETGGGCLGGGGPETLPLWGWIKAALGAGLLLWAGRRGRRTQLWPRHFKNLLLFHLNSPPPPPKTVPPRMAFPLWNQGPRICAPLCCKGSSWRGRGMPPPRPAMGEWGRGTHWAGSGWGVWGSIPSRADCQVTQPPGQHTGWPWAKVSMTTCSFHARSDPAKQPSRIAPSSRGRGLRPSLLPLAPSHRLQPQKGKNWWPQKGRWGC